MTLKPLISPRKHSARRRGFSVVELMVVIAIIAVLVAMLSAGFMKYYSMAPQKNTQTLLMKLLAELDKQWKAAGEMARYENITKVSGQANTWTNLMSMSGGDSQKAMDLWIQCRRAQEFPMTLSQATGGVSLNGVSLPGLYGNSLTGGAPSPTGPSKNLGYESSMCLYQALNRARGGAVFDAGNMSPRELYMTPSGVPCFVDGWNNPLQFSWSIVQASANQGGGLQYVIFSAGMDQIPNNADDLSTNSLRLGR